MEEVSALIAKSQTGDKAAREMLIENNLGLVHAIVRRYVGRGMEAEDLFQIGVIGLMKAIDKFDLNYDVKFSTYAVPLISGEIKRFLRDDGPVKVSRTLKENDWKVKKAERYLQVRLGRAPTLGEIAAETELTVDEIVQATESGKTVESIYSIVCQSDGSDTYLIDKMAEKQQPVVDEVVDRLLLRQLLSELSAQERQLIYLRFFQDKKQVEVARLMGITQVQVSRLEKKILLTMRKRAEIQIC